MGPKVFKEKPEDTLFQMPPREEIVEKAKELLIKLYDDSALSNISLEIYLETFSKHLSDFYSMIPHKSHAPNKAHHIT